MEHTYLVLKSFSLARSLSFLLSVGPSVFWAAVRSDKSLRMQAFHAMQAGRSLNNILRVPLIRG